MEINTCRYCHKVFNDVVKSNVCKKCRAKSEEEFRRIETYLLQHPNSNALQIAEALEIQAYEILAFIDDGRLSQVKKEK